MAVGISSMELSCPKFVLLSFLSFSIKCIFNDKASSIIIFKGNKRDSVFGFS